MLPAKPKDLFTFEERLFFEGFRALSLEHHMKGMELLESTQPRLSLAAMAMFAMKRRASLQEVRGLDSFNFQQGVEFYSNLSEMQQLCQEDRGRMEGRMAEVILTVRSP